MKQEAKKQLTGILVFFVVTFIGTVALWILDLSGIVKNVLLSGFTISQYWGFLAGDAFAMPLLLVAIIGLIRMRFWGYVATQIEMGTWIYTSVASLVATITKGGSDVFVIIWSPIYVLIGGYVILFTWRIRDRFI